MLKSYNFWIRLVAVLVLLLRIIGAELGFSVDSGLIIDLATAIASVLVVLGVIQVPVQKVELGATSENINENKNGGEVFVKTFEQIKEDLTKVKEKIASSILCEDLIKGEVSSIIDGIINDGEETEVKTEEVTSEIETVIVPEVIAVTTDEEAIKDETIAEEKTEEEVQIDKPEIIESDDAIEQETIIKEGVISEAEADELASKLVEDAVGVVDEFITEEEKSGVDMDKLNAILRDKIASLLVDEIDNILRDATI